MKNSEQEYFGAEALAIAQGLRETHVDPETWTKEYFDRHTGEVWILDYPNSELQGGGSPRLRLKHNRT